MVMSEAQAAKQDIRPIRIAILNLMPKKIETETQFARLIGAHPLQIELTLLRPSEHTSKTTSQAHIGAFYQPWEEVRDQKFDGLIIPVRRLTPGLRPGHLLGRDLPDLRLDPDQCAFHLRRLLGRHGDDQPFPRGQETHPARQGLWLLSAKEPGSGITIFARLFRHLRSSRKPLDRNAPGRNRRSPRPAHPSGFG